MFKNVSLIWNHLKIIFENINTVKITMVHFIYNNNNI